MSWFLKICGLQDTIDFLSKKYSLDRRQVEEIAKYDPIPGMYLEWMCRMVRNGNLRFSPDGIIFEDGPKVREHLELFSKLKRSPQFQSSRDINSYKTYADLIKVTTNQSGNISKQEKFRGEVDRGASLIYNKAPFKVMKLTTVEACSKYCKGTEWCVKDPKFAKPYGICDKDPMFLVYKNDQRVALMNFKYTQFRGADDEIINEALQDELRDVYAFLASIGYDITESDYVTSAMLSGNGSELPYYVSEEFNKEDPFVKFILTHIPFYHVTQDDAEQMYYFIFESQNKDMWARVRRMLPKLGQRLTKYLTIMLMIDNEHGTRLFQQELNEFGQFVNFREAQSFIYQICDCMLTYRPNLSVLEPVLSHSSDASYTYAIYIGKRFPAGEPAIIKDKNLMMEYVRDVIKGPWIEAERDIFNNNYGLQYVHYLNAMNFKEEAKRFESQLFSNITSKKDKGNLI